MSEQTGSPPVAPQLKLPFAGVSGWGSAEMIDQNGFRTGNILKITMHNLMTFRDVELFPGPRLNMIIGPNGAGKSTIVNALCIVFAGSLSILGRSVNLVNFIRNGEKNAFVEAVICDLEKGPIVIRREFDSDKSSQYLIGGAKARKGDVEALRLKYGIQLENLTQFLPQEKIAQFTEMSRPELLKATISALGGEKRLAEYTTLLADYDELEHLNQKANYERKSLKELQEKNNRIQVDVELFKERQQILEKIDLMEMLLPWVLYESALYQYNQDEKEHKAALGRVSEAKKEYKKACTPIRAKEEDFKEQSSKEAKAKKAVAKNDKRVRQALDDLEASYNAIEDFKGDYQNAEKQAESRLSKLASVKRDYENALSRLEELPEKSSLDNATQEIQTRRLENNQLHSRLQAEAEASARDHRTLKQHFEHADAKLRETHDKKKLKMRMLEKRFSDLPRALSLIRENRVQFKGSVHGPIALEVNTSDEFHATVLGMIIPKWLRCCFVVENTEDHTLLSNLISQQRLEVQVVSTPDASHQFKVTEFDNVRELGIYAPVVDTFEAPEAIKRVLCAHASLHNIMIGDKSSTKNSAEIVNRGIMNFYTPDASFSARRSRYSGQFSKRSNPLYRNQPELFTGVSDDKEENARLSEERERLGRDLEDFNKKFELLKSELAGIAREGTVIEKEFRRIKGEREAITRATNVVAAKKKSVQDLENQIERDDPERVKEVILHKIMMAEKELMKVQLELVDISRLGTEKIDRWDREAMFCLDLNHELEIMENATKELKAAYDERKDQAKELDLVQQETGKACLRASEYAKKKCPNPGDYREKWEQFPDRLEELEEEIRQQKVKAASILGISEEIVEEYNRRLKQIEILSKRVNDEALTEEKRREHLDRRKSNFVSWLENNVQQMSEKFTELYSKIGCSGQLHLKKEDSLKDILLSILVSYRDKNDLRELSAQTNSGGERMVATMLYHFALQGLTPAPFRVVDEMNQGMDSIFERRILDIMLRDASTGDSPQCFLITPKLLLDLDYNEQTVTHIILNGDIDAEAWADIQRSQAQKRARLS